uniref:Uncharacterized protein n=1 Tax=Plectus sambesii TaxID=2011161 RepID=A0A914VL49_9BILA
MAGRVNSETAIGRKERRPIITLSTPSGAVQEPRHVPLFAQKCARCALPLLATDFVYRCLGSTYHTHCFACVYCGQQLKKGDQYLIIEGQIICRQDYELLLCNPAMTPGYYDPDATESNRKTPKRPRTILNSQQRRAFKASFEKSAKPCRKVREALAKETGLSVRVVQVWFQNQRAKMKKIQRKQELQKLHENRSSSNNNNNDKSAKSSDSERKSVDDAKSPTESLKSEDSDSEGEVFDQENGSEREPTDDKDLTNPIDKLYNMQTTYFAYTTA